eukprot:CAMPEP_0170482128 /NCGR_PEP_ID=MMETSP0208-20121228/2281_1 /TAXON_ID=197538 /ORGANISM="Strombidium inclinatum, Strain S3" /LENGTH=692 /DNA_ID=CAMNT_0010754929 /DNA_START=16 /DNA_END=2091 /DNA_ORIENTATION=-
MTRSFFGTFTRTLKQVAVISALLFSSDVAANESVYKLRLHKNLIKQTLDKNLEVILAHVEERQDKEAHSLGDSGALENLAMRVKPKEASWSNIDSDLFFDQGQIVMEINGLEFSGNGMVVDSKSGSKDRIFFNADVDLAQLVLSLDQELTDDGNLYPKVEIADVALTLHPEAFNVKVEGGLPLYKSKQFEESVKKWMAKQMMQRESEFKAALQQTEREIMSSFAFKKTMPLGTTAHSSLSETMTLEGDNIVINYVTEFTGLDLNELQKGMRTIHPKFSDELQHSRDVQVAIDENYLNSALFNLFYNQKSYSASEMLIDLIPENFLGGLGAMPIVNTVMTTQVWQFLFPGLKRYSSPERIDFRCGFNKDYLKKGQLENSKLSQVFFREGNQIDVDLNFGCGLYVYENPNKKASSGGNFDLNQIMEVFQALSADKNDPAWHNYKSFFISMSANVELDFSDKAKQLNLPDLGPFSMLLPQEPLQPGQGMPQIFGRLLKFTPTFNEVKVFDDEVEQTNEAADLNNRLQNLKEQQDNSGLKIITDLIFNQGIPLVPFPDVAPCLGLEAKDSSMQINDGYAVMSYDYDVYRSGDNCLFDIKRGAKSKEARIAKRIASNNKQQNFGQDIEKKLGDFASKLMKDGLANMPPLPPLDIAGHKVDLNDPTIKMVADQAIDKLKEFDINKVVKQGEDLWKMFQ